MVKKVNKELGSTMLKVIIAISAVIVFLIFIVPLALVLINPAKKFPRANDQLRKSDVNTMVNAVGQYLADNKKFPDGITTTPTRIKSDGVNICSVLVPTYIQSLPKDPSLPGESKITNCDAYYDTGYVISVNDQWQITVSAIYAQESPISFTK